MDMMYTHQATSDARLPDSHTHILKARPKRQHRLQETRRARLQHLRHPQASRVVPIIALIHRLQRPDGIAHPMVQW
jgi:hypothetical protein